MAGVKNHDYHILPPSIWPLAGSMAALAMASGGIMWMHSAAAGGMVFYAGLAGVLAVMYGWWNFLTRLWQQGALQGAKPAQAFYVAVGLGKTMTAADILAGRLVVKMGLAAGRPAEFSFIRLTQRQAAS